MWKQPTSAIVRKKGSDPENAIPELNFNMLSEILGRLGGPRKE